MTALELLAQLLDLAEVTKRLHPSRYRSCVIPEDRRGDADGTLAAPRVDDEHGLVHDRLTRLDRVPKRTAGLADAGTEDLAAALPDRLGARHARDSLRCTVERSDSPFAIHSEDTVGHAVQDDLGVLLLHRLTVPVHGASFFATGQRSASQRGVPEAPLDSAGTAGSRSEPREKCATVLARKASSARAQRFDRGQPLTRCSASASRAPSHVHSR